ncbi:hypothetical protein [Niallia oryzisoli]|uniref:hypothetical protein n=1 Tax=Niallia oryzisoli TaxID=1737571 RepID=UPI003735F486
MDFPIYLQLFGKSINPHPILESLAFMVGFQIYLKLKRPNHVPDDKAVGVYWRHYWRIDRLYHARYI